MNRPAPIRLSLAALAAAPLVGCVPGAGADPDGPDRIEAVLATTSAVPAATVEAVFDALPPCEALDPNARVDLDAGCADGGCCGMTATALEDAWGEATCSRISSTPTELHCAWPSGVWARFDDRDEDGLPDADDRARPVYLEPPYDGATSEGLGVGASLSCFVEILGYPDAVRLSNVDDAGWRFRSMAWSADGVEVFDLHGDARVAVLVLAGTE